MKKIALGLFGLVFCVALSGCATIFGDHNRTIDVKTYPGRAHVALNGQEVGPAPQEVTIGNPLSTNIITVSKKGYETTSRTVQTSFQGVGLLNIFFWPGFIVDALTGDMMKVTSPQMNIGMQKATA